MTRPLKIQSTGGFWLVLGALLLAASLRLLLWLAVACAVHELGHLAAVRALGGRVGKVRLTGVGAVICPRRERICSYREECLVALAGPAANLVLAMLAAAWARRFGGIDAYLLTGLSLALGVFNLLPVGPLDGGRILRAIVSRAMGPEIGEKIWDGLTWMLAAGLAGAGLWALGSSGNFMLLLCALWLLCRRRRRALKD